MSEGYSICFNEWALDKKIKDELGLLLIISSLTAEKGYCYASNDYLAKIFKTNVVTISRKIKILEEKKYIEIEYEKKGCLVISRKIRLTKMLTMINKNDNHTINKNVKENNISNINSTNNNNIIYSQVLPYEEIINYLNLKANTHYRHNIKKTQSLISARFNENFTLDDFKKVIDNKVSEWKNTDMAKYLRPETLFGTKFESYLNQKNKNVIPSWFNENIENSTTNEKEDDKFKSFIEEFRKD